MRPATRCEGRLPRGRVPSRHLLRDGSTLAPGRARSGVHLCPVRPGPLTRSCRARDEGPQVRGPKAGARGRSPRDTPGAPEKAEDEGSRPAVTRRRYLAMKALVYHGPGERSWEEVPDPQVLADTDVIVGVDTVTICGTDLHILKGDVPEVAPGTILGHEAVGTVEEVGSAVRSVQPGDHVLVSCIAGCGTCRFCREGRYGQCLNGGEIGRASCRERVEDPD